MLRKEKQTEAWKLEHTRLLSPMEEKKKKKRKKLSVKSTKQHIQGVGLLSERRVIVETGVTVEGVGAPVPVFWSPNQPPPVTPAHKVFQTTLV